MDSKKSPFLDIIEKKQEDNYLEKAFFNAPLNFFKFNSETKKFDKTGDCEIYIFKYKKDENSKEINRITILQNSLIIKLDFLKTYDCDPILDEETFVLRFNGIENSNLIPIACKFKDIKKAKEVLKIFNE